MKRGKKERFVAGVIVIALLLSALLSACSSSNSAGTKSGESKENQDQGNATNKDITLSIWTPDVTNAGIQKTPVADEIKKQTGVTLEVINGDTNKFKVLQAGGDLPDLITLSDVQISIKDLIESNQVIPLDDLIDQYAPNIKRLFPQRLEYSKKYMSNGKNQIYFLPIFASKADPNNPIINYNGFVGFYGRWDLYKEAGYPQLTNEDDLLNALKKMQDLHPKTENNKKVYALSAWTDWGVWPYMIPYPFSQGYNNQPENMMFDTVNGQAVNMYLSEEGPFWKALNFWNKGYRMGIVDPEGFTMKLDNYMEKVRNGQVLTTYASWWAGDANNNFSANNHPEQGMELLNGAFPVIPQVYQADAPLGWGASWADAITSNCKDPVAAIKWLDYMYSEEGARLIHSGVKGKDWDIIDGKPAPTQAYLDAIKSDPNYQQNEGLAYNKYAGLGQAYIMSDGYPAMVTMANDQVAKQSTQVDKEYGEYYGEGLTYPGLVHDKMIKEGKAQSPTTYWATPALVQQPSDETRMKDSKADQYMQANIAKIIMAKDDQAFAAAKTKALEDLKAMGLEEANNEMMKLWQDAIELNAKLTQQ